MNAQTSRPVLLGQDHIRRALQDDRFFSMLPEFAPLKSKLNAAHASMGTNCSTCRKRRIVQSFSADFVSILNRLSDDGMSRLKRYLGVDRLLVRAMDRDRNKVVLREV